MRRILAAAAAAIFSSCLPNANLPDPGRGPIVCITFDDASPTIYSVAFQCMKQIDPTMTATHFAPVVSIDTNPDGTRMTVANLAEMEAAGWETAGHTVNHANLTAIPIDSAEFEIKGGYDFLVQHGLHHESFAYPSGNYNATIEKIALQWFSNIRTAHDILYTDGVNRDELGYFAVKGTHSADDIIARVERARSLGAPLVVIGFHAVFTDSEPTDPHTYWTRESIFRKFLLYLKDQELPVMTIEKAMERLCRNCAEGHRELLFLPTT